MTALDHDPWGDGIPYGLPTLNNNGDEPDSWQPINLTTLPDQPPIQPTLGGIGIVYPGKRHVFSGPPESAKTLAAYAIGIQIVRQGGSFILIDFEMGAYDARSRLHELGATDDEIARIHYLEPDTPATQDRVQPLTLLTPDLVIVDAAAGAYNLQNLDDNKRADVEKLAALYVTLFWRKGIATIFIDHVVKDAETRGKYAIGSERKLGGADVHLGFETIQPISRGQSGHYKIVTHKDRGGYLQRGKLADLHLASNPDTHEITWEFRPAEHADNTTPFRPTHLMERVSIYLATQPEPVSRNTIATTVKGNEKHILTALDVLANEGFTAEQAGERGARLYTNITLYKEDDPACNPPTSATSANLRLTSAKRKCLTSASPAPPSGGLAEVEADVEGRPPPRETSWLDDLADLTYLDSIRPEEEDDDQPR